MVARFPTKEAKYLSLLRSRMKSSRIHPASQSVGTGGCFARVKEVGASDLTLTPPNAEVANDWSYTSTPLMPS